MATVLFGYRTVHGIPPCPCNDPGTYMSLVCPDESNPLKVEFHCWCGGTMRASFDSEQELVDFVAGHQMVNGTAMPSEVK